MHKRYIKHLYNLSIPIWHALPDAAVIDTPNKNKNTQNEAEKEKFFSKDNIWTVWSIPTPVSKVTIHRTLH